MLPVNTMLGQLELVEVYEYLDGPRLFAAVNNVGTLYLVYWFDEKPNATGWLYLPISEARLGELRRREMNLNEAFKEPETNYYIVYTGIPPQPDTANLAKSSDIDPEYLPPEGFYIEHVDVVSKRYDWVFETILKGQDVSAGVVSQFIGRFRELAEDIMNTVAGTSPRHTSLQLYPLGMLPGSIQIKFDADDDATAVEALSIIEQLVQADSEQEFHRQLREYRVNPSQLRDFLTAILRNKLEVGFSPKLASHGFIIRSSEEQVEQIKRCISYLDAVTLVQVDSIKIPQANDIDKVIKVVELIHNGIPLTPQNIEVTAPRQVRYYKDAAYALGLASRDEQLTAAGQFLILHPDVEQRYQILADRFDSTDFGFAWLRWAGVKYMTELDPDTAEEFIRAAVPNLSGDTPRRRASTLRQWLDKLQPYHRKYREEES